MEKTKKKNRRLLIQVGAVTAAMLLTAIAITLTLIYVGTVNVYLEAKNDMLIRELERVYSQMVNKSDKDHSLIGWSLDYWQKHPLEVLTYNPDEHTHSQDAEALFLDGKRDVSTLEALDEEDKLFTAHLIYVLITSSLSIEKDLSTYDSLFCIDVSPENEGFVFFSNTNDVTSFLGDKWDLSTCEHPAINRLREGSTESAEFERVEDFPLSGNHYVCYLPLRVNGELRCVLGISHNWSDIASGLRGYISVMTAGGIAGIIVIGGLLLLFIYFKAIRPLSKVKNGVVEYINTKDSRKAAGRMSEIKARNEVGVLADSFSELAVEINRYNEENLRLSTERERISAELELAAKIQYAMLSEDFPQEESYELYASMTPAKEVGGDFYDFFTIDSDHLGLVIADVSGKGVPAALFMMMSKSVIRSYAMRGDSPAEVLRLSNTEILAHNEEQMFVTVWFGVLELSTGRVIASNAGHEYPVIRQPDGQFELFKDKHSAFIGARARKGFKEYEFTLQKGGTLFLYTDGVPEATDISEKMFGTARLVETLNRDPGASPRQLIETVHSEVNAFVKDAPQFDDLTMLGITYLGAEKKEQDLPAPV